MVGIINIFVIIWICVYSFAIFDRDEVWFPRNRHSDYYDRGHSDPDDPSQQSIMFNPSGGGLQKKVEKSDHVSTSKMTYVIWECIPPFINAIFFISFFYMAKDWVDVHAN